ncbi:MAG: NAD(P)-dependent oxidoreductase [Nostocoides sp.]
MPVVSLPDQSWIDAVGALDGVHLVAWDLTGPPPVPVIDVVVPPYLRPVSQLVALSGLSSLRVVQLLTAGYETAVEYLPPGVVLANASGVHDDSTAELGVALALALLRGIPDFVRSQERATWLRAGIRTSLADRRALVVGYGSVGRAVAERLVAFKASVTAVASGARAGDDLVDSVHAVDELPSLLPQHDLVVVVTPLTEATRHLVNEEFLSALPDGALVVNIARGGVADTEAMVRHAGRLLFGLDVTEPEPLPDGHPLWSAPGVLISPHVGGASTAFAPRAVELLRAQLTRIAAGVPPMYVVATG